ncbi:SusD/RagB family nutrient-binding outer membrane lipoprotein [Fulvivirga sediminis]|uniref:SusD/RagB family nutrient-binding outer membrane lipoprotein n=1 Tax=Fulvivirga sediminis TaxID=2803949 RepID=A0A937K1A2_9BACT|nr:SusD/RagB family nutrient-binding outer membrane lipoprotein [Fulvivirga sediminis]MBL3658404.1 SusD/RagB family nutrient-binding outer membrane lipoprotein [Fulvivirga sediminis]
MRIQIKFMHFLSLIVIIIGTSACGNDELFGEKNTNKEAFSSLSPNLLFTTVQASLSGNRLEQWGGNLVYGEGMVQHLGGSKEVTEYGAIYNFDVACGEALWQSNYGDGVMRHLVDILERTKNDDAFKNLNAAAKILKVMVFQRLTDFYGAIPYSEAGLGYYRKIYYPKYDGQKEIYYNFFALLEEAYYQFDESSQGDEITGDNFYNGDISKWKKLANSLILRCAMRISMVDKAKAIKEIQIALTNGLFENIDDSCLGHHENVEFGTPGASLNGNGLSQALKGNGGVLNHPTQTLIKYLEGDPRKDIWFMPGNLGNIEGINPNNFRWEHPGGAEKLAVLQPYLYRNDAPYMHISYAETQLLLAEAVVKRFIPGNAEVYYQEGIKASILQWSAYGARVSIQEAESFSEEKTLAADNGLGEIITQQWLNHFLNGMEAYANYRRTRLPVLEPIIRSSSATNGVMPSRLRYPESEAVVNGDNYEIAAKEYTEGWLSHIWWDIN